MTKPKSKIRKVDGDKDVGGGGGGGASSSSAAAAQSQSNENKQQQQSSSESSSCTATAATVGLGSSPSSQRLTSSSSAAWLISELQHMMFGFGDCPKPLLESAKLIETILRQQMSLLLNESIELATTRGSRFIGLEELLFIMRKDKANISRLIKYLSLKDKMKVLLNVEGGGTESEESTDTLLKSGGGKRSRKRMCQEFLSTIDQTGEFMSLFNEKEEIFDEVKRDRDLRAYMRSEHMGTEEYIAFAEARSSSFCRKYPINKFRDWLLKGCNSDLKPNPIALEVFNYLAYETVAQIVDLALLVKNDMKTDDLSLRGIAPVTYNQNYPCVRVPKSPRPTSPPQTDALTSQSQQSLSPNPLSLTEQSSPTPHASKTKTKKRKRPVLCPNIEIPITNAIQPSDIFEAMRRFHQPFGPITPFTKLQTPQVGRKLLCA